jgi:membrane fusion protein, peptide pheromone/bacteriocin exporter
VQYTFPMAVKVYPIPPDQTREYLFTRNRITSQAIYKTVLVVITMCLIALPFIQINISVSGRGIVRPTTEKAEIKALTSSRILAVYIKEGQKIITGDTMILLQNTATDSRMVFVTNELKRLNQYINDLNLLLDSVYSGLASDVYIRQLNKYQQGLQEKDLKVNKARYEVDRNKKLLEKNFIAQRDYDDLIYILEQATKERQIFIDNQKSMWSNELSGFISERENLAANVKELQKQKDLHIIKSPVTGTIEEFNGIYEGTDISEGQLLAIISPETDLIVEVYISAKEIGYIQPGSDVRFQVDAFNYNEWGIIEGNVQSISEDFIMVDNSPAFKIKCSLDKNYLSLDNGVKGYLKKGMTLNARFMITRKSLFQLIYQSADDWINPARY